MLFHYQYSHVRLASAIKKVNPCIRIYLKCDAALPVAQSIVSWIERPSRFPIWNAVKKRRQERGIAAIDLFSCETEDAFLFLKQHAPFADRLALVPNGYDDENM